jgi:2-dehydropantoate 2-reductase
MVLSNERFAVFGAGALGCYFGASLTRAGHSVVMIARGPHLAAIRRAGITVETPRETFTVAPQQVSNVASDLGPVAAVILAVKAWQVREAAEMMSPLLAAGTRILPLQNGVEAYEQLTASLGEVYPLLGLCRVVCELVEPGRVRHRALEPTITLGEPNGVALSGNAQVLVDALLAAGVVVQTHPNMAVALWQKLMFIAAFSGVGAVSRSNAGEMRQLPPTRMLLQQVMEEVAAVARTRGVSLGDEVIRNTMSFIESLPTESTASMHRDIIEGRPSELEAILGVVVRFGKDAGVAVPVTEFLYGSLLPQENRARLQAN